jgi:hypothetical protein
MSNFLSLLSHALDGSGVTVGEPDCSFLNPLDGAGDTVGAEEAFCKFRIKYLDGAGETVGATDS